MPLRDIFKRQVENLLSTDSNRQHPSLGDDLRSEFDRTFERAIDPGREEREAGQRAAELQEIRSEKGSGQPLQLEGVPGDWEATELLNHDETSVTFSLIDRHGGGYGQLGAGDDGTVILDSPADQFVGRVAGAMWQTETQVGIRLHGAELKSDHRRVRVTCDLRDELSDDDAEADYSTG